MSNVCAECWEDFREDDTGGYNPPCRCGLMCRDCCDAKCAERADDVDDGDYIAERVAERDDIPASPYD
jgi:hypothetical protein